MRDSLREVQHVLAVQTAPRPGGVSYLARTLSEVDTSGAAEWTGPKILYSDGPPPSRVPFGWELVTEPEPFRDQKKALWAIFALALARGADCLTVLEDDLRFARNALRVVARTPVPDHLALLKWYDGTCYPDEGEGIVERDIQPTPAMVSAAMGICAVTYPRRTLEKLVAHPRAANWDIRHFGDGLVGVCLAGEKLGIYMPNPIQHIGAVAGASRGSVLGAGRRSPSFRGVIWDAMLGAGTEPEVCGSSIQPSLTPQALADEILDAVRETRPYSHLRFGDGEAALLLNAAGVEDSDYAAGLGMWCGADLDDKAFAAELRDAVSNASNLGIDRVSDLVDRGLRLCVPDLAAVRAADSRAIYLAFAQTDLVPALIGKRVLLVGNAAQEIAEFAKLPSWRSEQNNWMLQTDAVKCERNLGLRALAFRDEVVAHWRARRHDLVLCGAGAPGKVICASLAREGAVAVDVGRLFEALRGTAGAT